jgi:hypothetical protein
LSGEDVGKSGSCCDGHSVCLKNNYKLINSDEGLSI